MSIRHRRELNENLSNNSTLSQDSFFKLLALGLFDIIITLPLSILGLVSDVSQSETVGFWPGWDIVHGHFGKIPKISSKDWKAQGFWSIFNIRFDQWVNVICAAAFFLLFGLTKSKRAWYRSLFRSIKPLIGLKVPETPEVTDMEFSAAPGAYSSSGGTTQSGVATT